MDTATKERVKVKIFVGFEISIELRIQLNHSPIWKQVSVVKEDSHAHLQEVRYQEKDYIGRYLDHSMITFKDVKVHAKTIRDTLQEYCQEYNVDALKINIFPQVFVA